MKLKQAKMQMRQAKWKKIYNISKLVFLWEEVGLCIHKGEYRGKAEKETYVISHFNSGLSVLKYIRSQEQAKSYMQILHDEVLEDWTFTSEEWWSEENRAVRSEMKVIVDKLQKEILEGRRHE
jgi:hypothetical protein